MLPTLEAAELPADAIEVGRIADAWGIKGWFKVLPHSAQPEALFSSKRWFLQAPGDSSQVFRLPVREAKEHSDCIVAASAEVPDRTAAEALRGARVFVPRSSFPTPGDDEYYWVDLIGLSVVNREGVALGTVRELMANGPQTTLVLATEQDGKAVERLIPFVAAFVDKVDLAGRLITVDWQADY
ncbi:MAG TPA: ribosome maturation factor RimM [Burkholderiaceae bacterium]|nr:ribosome maturation factor RimM [Pseudomonadota bacterium]MDQ7998844.1 ribosome maturation factor RimM [Pseudomonadota bacterium]MDQ8019525.1 ribosome maturation factor RimM [Pseudomonadota bacterium]HZF82344.1 ribosome maturation factor RimM [Burkholderiaceae bacterium]